MTQEQFEKAQSITQRMEMLEKEFDKWQKCNRIYGLRLGVVDTMDCECVDETLIDFDKLKDETMASIKAKIDELQTEFENL